MYKNIILLLLACLGWGAGNAQTEMPEEQTVYRKVPKTYRYRVAFTDKKNNGYSLKHPEAFLSARSLERRARYGLKVDHHDLPVTPAYLDSLRRMGLKVCNWSKWNNTAVVELADTTLMQQVRRLKFVQGDRLVRISPDSVPVKSPASRHDLLAPQRDTLETFYGHANSQNVMLGVDTLHRAGYRGAGVLIAVIDGGFFNADIIPGLKQAKVLGTRNFVRPEQSVYDEAQPHGMMVLSCIAANEPNSFVGTAPEASFYLLQSEDSETEQLVEEDNWCAAVEYADSLGCDMITSSLGYQLFDHEEMNHHYWELDGATALNSRSASLAASRGILLLNSAGNSGDEPWKKIGVPADAKDMLAVGAVTFRRRNTNFSSLGNAADGRIKPNVMAQGQFCAVYDVDGTVGRANGTSFACPIMCGAAACLIQQFPHKRPTEIIDALQRSGNNAAHPDNVYGYGIPSLPKAAEWLKKR